MAKQAVLELIADASKLKSTLNDAEGQTDKFGSSVGKLGGVLAGALTGAAVVKFGSDAVKAFTESEQAQSKLDLALKNNSATVGVQAADFAKFNRELAKTTLADDDVIAATEAQMATFGASKEQIMSMIPTVMDFAAKMGVEGPEAADLFDKASLGSAKALKTLGIEGYKPVGDKATDLANIQGLLKDKVKGAAQAQLDAAGPGATMKKSMDELQETVGKYLVPALSKIVEVGVKVADFFAGHPVIMIMVGAIGALAAGIWVVNTATALFAAQGAIANAMATVAAVRTGAWAAVQWVLNAALTANPIGLVVAAIAALVAIIVIAYKNSETFRDIVDGAFTVVKNVVMGVYNWVKDNWPLLLAILTGPIGVAVLLITQHWDTIKNAFTAVKNWIFDRIGDIVGFFTGLPGRLAGAAGDVFRFVRDLISDAKQWVSDRIGDIVGFFTGMPGRISAAVSGLFDGIKGAFKGALNGVIGMWNDLRIPSFTFGGWDTPFGKTPSFTTPSINFPDISPLALGGIVTRPTLAMIGEAGPEAVIPLSRFGGGGGVVTNYYEISVTAIDPASAQEAVITAIREYERRNGQGWRT